jgi:NitT/TauT family transport system substrate-binding protein
MPAAAWGGKNMRPFKLRILAASAACLSFAPQAVTADALKLAVGQRGSWETAISELGQTAGIFKKHGLELQIVYTQGTGETLQAVVSGSVDVGIAVGMFGVMGAYAKGAPIRAIGSTMTGANDLLWYGAC